MRENEFERGMSLRNVLNGFIRSYAQRDTDADFSDWLADRLREEIPELEPEASAQLVGDIIEAIAGYDQTLHDLNQAIEAGQSKEEWLSEQLEEIYSEVPMDAAGKSLQRMETELISSNMQFMGEGGRAESSAVSSGAVPADWNRYSLKAKVNSIGKQLNSVALDAAAGALERNLNGEKAAISDVIADAFQTGLNASPGEVKAVVAGAVRVSAEKALADTLPSDTPIEVIGDLAGAAVEGAEALCDAANGDISMTDALDKIGRAGVAAGCRAGAGFLQGKLMTLPGGPVLVDLLGGLLDHMESSQFINSMYITVRGAAIATWEGIKQSNVVQSLKRLGQTLFN